MDCHMMLKTLQAAPRPGIGAILRHADTTSIAGLGEWGEVMEGGRGVVVGSFTAQPQGLCYTSPESGSR